jgi:hypothetical protein
LKAPSDCPDWLPLWKRLFLTHYAVCRGARVFGELYLNLRGGLSPSLAEDDLNDWAPEERDRVRRGRRRMLALGWLSVEDDAGGQQSSFRMAEFPAGHQLSTQEAERLLRSILELKGVSDPATQQSWIRDCVGALTARIRDDAVWVSRAGAFDAWRRQLLAQSGTLLQEQAKEILCSVFGSGFWTLDLPSETEEVSESESEVQESEAEDQGSGRGNQLEEESDPSNASRGVYSDLFGGDAEQKQARSQAKVGNARSIADFLRAQPSVAALRQNLAPWREARWDPIDTAEPEKYPIEVTSGLPPEIWSTSCESPI